MIGTGAEVEGQIEIGGVIVIASEVDTSVLATAVLITPNGRHLRAALVLALIYLTPPETLPWIDPHRIVLLALLQASMVIDNRSIQDQPRLPTGIESRPCR